VHLLIIALAVLPLFVLDVIPFFTASDDGSVLRLILSSILLASIVSLFIITESNLLTPLIHLRSWIRHMRKGEFSSRIPAPGKGELKGLMTEINKLGDTIQNLSRDMEKKVQQQTRHIAEKNVTLQILYDVASSVSITQDIQDLLSRSLHALRGVIDARAAAIRLLDADNNFRIVATSGFLQQDNDYALLKTAELEQCEMAYESLQIQELTNLIDKRFLRGTTFSGIDRLGLISVPLSYHGNALGVYSLFIDSTKGNKSSEFRGLLMNIGQHLGMAIQKARLDEEARRISIIDERNRLAHELHDSLAQSLASLRFQVRVLDDTLHTGVESAVWHELERIENSLDEAYQELRDLIAHCRIRSDHQDLVQNIKALVNRYRNESNMHFLLQVEWGEPVLSSEYEIQILRIIQESLRNIYKHSDANTVRIMLRQTGEQKYEILIEDDGVGFSEQPANTGAGEHVGLKIMKERARRFGGSLEIESEPGEGTRVILTFSISKPEYHQVAYTRLLQ
jgi:two-component system nitrate/nitrite sensor histidine kinase NarX